MKLASYRFRGQPGWGVVTDTGIAPLADQWPAIGDGLAAGLPALGRALARQPARIALADVEWSAPVTPSCKILCVGINYALHIAESRRETPAHPSIFIRFADSFVGHGQAIVRPAASGQFDFEAELAVVIGRRCRHASVDDALDYVGGYTCLGDNSVRDFQKHAAQVTAGKNWDSSGSIGPWIVTADEIGAPQDLAIACRLNGAEMQRGHSADMLFPVARLVSYISTFTTLRPGDIIATGTPSGVGASRTPPRWMQAGDRLEIEIAGIGVLANPVIQEAQATGAA